ncbi:hypothetical protein LEP1GSC041_1589 [Leptospira noguchii str. 2006001870]|nr:hypothetical protein LEP1GSC041_1589 [Leptospira noguchii str. 2006001870]
MKFASDSPQFSYVELTLFRHIKNIYKIQTQSSSNQFFA